MDAGSETFVEQLLACTTGRAWLALADAAGAVEAAARDLGTAQCLASRAVAETPEHGGGAADAWLAQRLPQLRAAAERLVAAAGGAVPDGWSGGHGPAVQRWAATGAVAGHGHGRDRPHDRATTPGATGSRWEAHAQLPSRWVVTDDEVVDVAGRTRGGVDEWDAHGLWDVGAPAATQVRRWRVVGEPHVVVVDGPQGWVRLCEQHPGPVDGHSGTSLDWVAFAEEADGVHLTLRGLLTARRLPRDGDAPRLWAWCSTGTRWARRVAVEELPPDPVLPAAAHAYPSMPRTVDGDPRFDEGDEVDGSELDV